MTNMSHSSCPFINPNGSCTLPTCFEGRCDSSTPSAMSLFVDMQHESGVFKVQMPKPSMVLYVPPVLVLLDSCNRTTNCHVVASWWWSERRTLFIQVYMGKETLQRGRLELVTKWQVDDFPLTCVGNDGRYLVNTIRGALVKTKRKTE